MSATAFYDATQGLPALPILLHALTQWHEPPGLAVDLGCGAGRDTLELLRCGWRVLAIDREPEALQRLCAQVTPEQAERLDTRLARFEALTLPRAELVNSSFALPFCTPDRFADLWRAIEQAVPRGGLFAGYFFGERDQWASPDLTIHSRERLDAQFADWALLHLQESERDGLTAKGACKHWHLFSVVARRG